MELMTYHRIDKHKGEVKGIAPLTLLRTDVGTLIPRNFRAYEKPISKRREALSRSMCLWTGEPQAHLSLRPASPNRAQERSDG